MEHTRRLVLGAGCIAFMLGWLPVFTVSSAEGQDSQRDALLARAAAAEFDTIYGAPPGDPLSHHTS